MSNSEIQIIDVTITPQFNLENQAECLNIRLTIESPNLQAGKTIVSFPSNLKRSTSIPQPEASDDLGNLPIVCKDENGNISQEWLVERDTRGPVVLTYSAFPSTSGKPVCQGAAIDLLSDQGGLLGSGLSFIPTPPGDKIYRNTVEWDLHEAAQGTRAVWTFGEGPERVEKVGPASILSDSVYMVGPISSNPATPIPGTISDYYGYYWFGTLPPNIEAIKDIHHAFLLKVSDFFSDTPSASNPHRSFVRNTTPAKSFGGTSFIRSHIFDYDDQISVAHDYDLVRRMAYEVIHIFLGPSVTDPNIDWLYEGIKNALSVYLPFRPPNQFRTGHYFQATICLLCMKYYTSPLLHVPHDEVLALALKNDAYAKELLATRAWAFVLGTDLASRDLMEYRKPPHRPMEDLAVKVLASKKRNGEPHGVEEFVELLTPLMGKDVRERYEYMRDGKLISIPVRVFGASTHRLEQIDQEILDFGMNRESFDKGFVKGLKAGSRAEKAGLKEGERIVRSSHTWKCVDDFEAEMEVVVHREGKNVSVRYWPRAFEKAKSWVMNEVKKQA